MKRYTIPYQYTIIGHATVFAESLQEAVELVQDSAPCPEPDNSQPKLVDMNITNVKFSYLEDSFEIHEDDLDLYGNPK